MFKRTQHSAKRFTPKLIAIGLSWLVIGLAGCEPSTEQYLIGQPARPYRLTLTLEPAQPRAGQEVSLTFRITDGTLGQAVAPLQILHERALHTFIVSRDLSLFAHTHHEDFFPLTPQDLAAATFHFPHTFPRAGEYMLVSEFTYKNRSWLKQFRLRVAGAEQSVSPQAQPDLAQPDLAREKDFGPYHVTLRTSPDPPVAGHEVALVCELSRDGSPVTNLGLYLGTEVHMASWRLDGEHFGHQHTYTPEMAAMMEMMRNHEQTAKMKAEMDAMMVQLMSGPAKQVYQGPQIPVHHVFPTPGLYKLFFETAPGGTRLVTDFIVQVVEYDEGVDTSIQIIVPPSDKEPTHE